MQISSITSLLLARGTYLDVVLNPSHTNKAVQGGIVIMLDDLFVY
jgi:hypothetical protein